MFFFFQAWYLLRAEAWNEAHKVIVEKIAPDAIINDDYEFFFSLLQDLANLQDTSTKVTNWQTQGQVFYDFITVDLKVRELLGVCDCFFFTHFSKFQIIFEKLYFYKCFWSNKK